jgi:hypothetical protein
VGRGNAGDNSKIRLSDGRQNRDFSDSSRSEFHNGVVTVRRQLQQA